MNGKNSEDGAPGAGSSSASVRRGYPKTLLVLQQFSENSAECLKAEKAALVLIARAEQCSSGLRRKLEKKKYPDAVIQAVLNHLTEMNLVNDRRYAELWLKSRIGRETKGPRLLYSLLIARGIEHESAEEALAAVITPDAEAAMLRRCLEKFSGKITVKNTIKKSNSMKNSVKNSIDEKTAIRFFLKRQGFSSEAVTQYYEEL